MTPGHILAVNRPGDPGWIQPGSEQHAAMISPSKIAAILGVSRWESPYRLWHRTKGLVDPEPPKDAFDLGHDAEPFAANRWRRLNPGWLLSPGEVQFVIDPEHFGFPAVCTLDRRAVRGRSRRVVEVKVARNLTDLDHWGDDLTGDAPADYTSQILAQMLLSGFTSHPGHLLALGPYFNERIYEIPFDRSVAAWMITEVRSFWESLKSDTAPDLDDSVATYECVRALHPDIDGSTVEIRRGLAVEYLASHEQLKDAEKWERSTKTRLLDAMGNAQHAVCNGSPVARRQPGARGAVALHAAKIGADTIPVDGVPA